LPRRALIKGALGIWKGTQDVPLGFSTCMASFLKHLVIPILVIFPSRLEICSTDLYWYVIFLAPPEGSVIVSKLFTQYPREFDGRESAYYLESEE
jgi:hypothetical protein